MSKGAVTQHWNKSHQATHGLFPGTITPSDQLSDQDMFEIAQSELNSVISELRQVDSSEENSNQGSNGSESSTESGTLPASKLKSKGSKIKHPRANGVCLYVYEVSYI
jgi:hypothetical protein